MGGRATVRRKLCNLPPSDGRAGQSVTDYEPIPKMIGTRLQTLLTAIFSGNVRSPYMFVVRTETWLCKDYISHVGRHSVSKTSKSESKNCKR